MESLTVADVGRTRLEKVLHKDKLKEPAKICEVLKSDITKVARNYCELDGEIFVGMNTDKDNFNFCITFSARRLKTFGSLPEFM